jgi:hypothetical protein
VSELPVLGRRGFRDWSEVLADLRAIAEAPPPLNQARVWHWDPGVGGVAPIGPLETRMSDDDLIVSVDGEAVVSRSERPFAAAGSGSGRATTTSMWTPANAWQIQVSGPGGLP